MTTTKEQVYEWLDSNSEATLTETIKSLQSIKPSTVKSNYYRYLDDHPDVAETHAETKKHVATKKQTHKPKKQPSQDQSSKFPSQLSPPAPSGGSFSLSDIESYIAYCLTHPETPANINLINAATNFKKVQSTMSEEREAANVEDDVWNDYVNRGKPIEEFG